MAEGSVICFDYPSEEEGSEAKTNRLLAKGAGEQMKAIYARLELEKLLSGCGFKIISHLDHDEMTEQYFSDYNHCNREHPMKAPVGVGYVLAKKLS